jgi:hypothetical protein
MLEARLAVDVTILREPFTADLLRAAVRPLLPLLSIGTTLAWRGGFVPAMSGVEPPTAKTLPKVAAIRSI